MDCKTEALVRRNYRTSILGKITSEKRKSEKEGLIITNVKQRRIEGLPYQEMEITAQEDLINTGMAGFGSQTRLRR